MIDPVSERRLVENQVYFRQPNKRVAEGFAELKVLAEAHNQSDLIADTNTKIQFYCECSDDKCRQRILLTPDEYLSIHKNSDQFVLLPGHNVAEIERIILSHENYVVVEKYLSAPEHVDKLNPTGMDNHDG